MRGNEAPNTAKPALDIRDYGQHVRLVDNRSHPPDIQNGEIITIRHQRYRVAAVGRRHLKLRFLGPK